MKREERARVRAKAEGGERWRNGHTKKYGNEMTAFSWRSSSTELASLMVDEFLVSGWLSGRNGLPPNSVIRSLPFGSFPNSSLRP